METKAEKNKGGRPEGSMNRLAREAREKAQATGMLPHEIMLTIARGEPLPKYEVCPSTGKRVQSWEPVPDLSMRLDAAKGAAPYYAPKISTVEVISGVAEDELDRIIAQLAAEAGISLGDGGEEPQGETPASPPGGRRRVQLGA